MSASQRKISHIKTTTFITILSVVSVSMLLAGMFTKSSDNRPSNPSASQITFDEGSGSTTSDSLSTSNVGTITNASWKPQEECLLGTCIYFDGNGDFISFGDNAFYDITTGSYTIGLWFKTPDITSGTRVLVSKYRGDDVEGGYKIYMTSDGKVHFGIDDDNSWGPDDVVSSASSYDDSTWHHLSAVKNGTTSISLYIDALLVGTDTSISATGTLVNDDNFTLGMDSDGSSNPYTGYIDSIVIYSGEARTASQVKTDAVAGASEGGAALSVGNMNPILSNIDPIGRWKFDEGDDTTAEDTSGNSNSLTLSADSWTTSGKFYRSFLGASNTRLTRDDDSDFDFAAADDFTLSVWFKRDAVSATEYLIHKQTSDTGYALYMDSDGDLVFGIGDGATAFPEETIGGSLSKNYDDNSWHHAVAVKTGTASIKLYVDGQEIASDTSLSVTGTLANSAKLIIADANETDGTDEFLGSIDELEIYRSALTADQIAILYNQGQSAVFGNLSTASDGQIGDNSADRSYCVPGDTATCNPPVGEWTLDENTGTTTKDLSGNNGTGTLTNDPTWTNGYKGSAVNFDGTDDYIAINNTGTLNLTGSQTIIAWINPTSLCVNVSTSECTIFANGNDNPNYDGIALVQGGGGNLAGGINFHVRGTTDDAHLGATAVIANSWQMIAGIKNSAAGNGTVYFNQMKDTTTSGTATPTFSSANVSIGRRHMYSGSTNPYGDFSGKIDTVRVYDYARTPAQLAWDYNRGAPVSWYKFDECTGTTAYNSAVNPAGAMGNNGTIAIPGGGTYTSAGTCSSGTSTHAWNAGTTGKKNSSIALDGTNDYISTSAHALITRNLATYTNVSFGGWFKASGSQTSKTLIYRGNTINDEFRLTTDSNGYPQCETTTGSTTWQTAAVAASALPDSSWTHLLCVYNGSRLIIYVNGKESGSSAVTAAITGRSSGGMINIGRSPAGSGYFGGLVDEIKIWNYDLNPTLINYEYQNGAVYFSN